MTALVPVTDVHAGLDRLIIVADVKTPNGHFVRLRVDHAAPPALRVRHKRIVSF